mgnify:CR=1 FL=1
MKLQKNVNWKLIIAVIILSISFNYQSVANHNIKLLEINGSNNYSMSNVWEGNFTAANGKNFYLGKYYQSLNSELSINGKLLIDLREDYFLILPFAYDNGYKSDLFRASPIISTGFSVYKRYQNLMVGFGFDNLFLEGGDIIEFPCIDMYNREFHCGTGVPWVDYEKIKINANFSKTAKILLNLRF